MKKNLSLRSLSSLAISAVAAAILNITLIAQPACPSETNNEDYITRLEQHIEATRQLMKYTAPETAEEWSENQEALQNLDYYTNISANGLKYVAPVQTNAEILDKVDVYAEATLKNIKYRAPEKDLTPVENITEHPFVLAARKDQRPVNLEYKRSANSSLFIQADYQKKGRIINKARRASALKSAKKQYVDNF
jgi:hypothetical protein